MSKAEKFISEHIRNCSNEYLTDSKPDGLGGYISRRNFTPWLTPDQARKAVEIAREEIYEWLSYHLDTSKMDVDYKFEVIEELRKAIKDE